MDDFYFSVERKRKEVFMLIFYDHFFFMKIFLQIDVKKSKKLNCSEMFCWPQGFCRTTKIFHFEDKGSSKYIEETLNSHLKLARRSSCGEVA